MLTRALVPAFLMVVLVASCASPGDDSTLERRRRPDAAVTSSPDAAPPPASGAGVLTCPRENNVSATCALPQVCCFSNYSSFHAGSCSAGTCGWGTMRCDGPDDCAGGQSCCAHATRDPDFGTTGWILACSASACGAPPFDRELCQPGGAPCSGGKSCVSAQGVANDLPRTLYVCN